jgi:hypothetical protein
MRFLFLVTAISIGTLGFASSCDHVKGTGEVVKKTITVADFHGINVEGAIDVVITQSATRSVEVEAQANIAELLTSEVRDGVWVIGTETSYSTTKPFIVHISIPTIDRVSIDGSGDVKGIGTFTADRVWLDIQGSGNMTLAFNAKTISTDLQGSGDVVLSGSCTELKATVQGSGDINAKDLASEDANVKITGSGDVLVSVNETLAAAVEGSGDVTYKGKPANLSRSVTGSGDVRSIESLAR